MKEPKESLYPPDWLKYARKDWRRIDLMLKDGDLEAAAFFLQQSLEKYLKTFLLQEGWSLKKIHDLDALLDDAVKYNPSLEAFRPACKRISGYYLIERYPMPVPPGLSRESIKIDIEKAREFIQAVFGKDEPKDV